MIPMFVKKSSTLQIDVYVYEENSNIEATHEKHTLPKDVQPETISFTFRRPNYADSNLILKQFRSGGGADSVDITALQNVAMNTMLVDWTIKDESGQKVAVNRMNVEALQPAIGRAAALGYLGQIKC